MIVLGGLARSYPQLIPLDSAVNGPEWRSQQHHERDRRAAALLHALSLARVRAAEPISREVMVGATVTVPGIGLKAMLPATRVARRVATRG